MKKPNIDLMWRTWIKIGSIKDLNTKMLQDTIREKISTILQLQKSGKINWFYFLYHNKPDDSANGYFDVVFTSNLKDPDGILPKYCINTTKISPMSTISGINNQLLKNNDICEAWRLIGLQSEFIINLVLAHSKNKEITPKQFVQFMHFFMNTFGFGNRATFPIDISGKGIALMRF